MDASGNVSVNDDSHNHVISNVDGLQTALDGKSATTHTHKYAGSDSAGGPANAVKDGVVTRAKLANDALYSPITYVSANKNLATTDLGVTFEPQYSPSSTTYTITITQAISTTLPIGFEFAAVYVNTNNKIQVSTSGFRVLIAGEGQVADASNAKAFTIPDIGGMVAFKKVNTGTTAGDLWVVTGNVEVV